MKRPLRCGRNSKKLRKALSEELRKLENVEKIPRNVHAAFLRLAEAEPHNLQETPTEYDRAKVVSLSIALGATSEEVFQKILSQD